MSVRIMTRVWDTDLPANEKLVLLALADCANDEGRCWPGLSSLCSKTGYSKRTLQECMRSLAANGHLTRTENPGKGMFYHVHPVATSSTGADIATGGKIAHIPVANSAPKPLSNHKTSRAKALSVRATTADQINQVELMEYAMPWASAEMGWGADMARQEFNRFTDNAVAHGRSYKDWRAAWRNWCRSPYCKTVSPKAAATAYRKEPLRV